MDGRFNSKNSIFAKLQAQIHDFIELIPFLNNVNGKTIVIKCGNNHISNRAIVSAICQDIALLQKFGAKVVLVHGGGSKIGELIKKFDLHDDVIDGHRVTNREVFDVVEMVLTGSINPMFVSDIQSFSGKAVGISGRDRSCIVANKIRRTNKDEGSNIERILDLGMVGEPIALDVEFLNAILKDGTTAVVSPIAIGATMQAYTINADTLACFIASKLSADKVIFLSDTDGIVAAEEKETITQINSVELQQMINKDLLNPSIIQKAQCSIDAVKNGVGSAHIINGMVYHAILMDAIEDDGFGTKVIFKSSGPRIVA